MVAIAIALFYYVIAFCVLAVSALDTGVYRITNFAGPQLSVACGPFEDISLNPKPILTLPAELMDQGKPWEVQKSYDNSYTLINSGAPVGVINDAVFAFLVDRPGAQWTVTPVNITGLASQLYTISTEGSYWTLVNDEPYQQVQVTANIRNNTTYWKFTLLNE